MNKDDDYIDGPHDYWIHFGCGLIFGFVAGAWIGSELFDDVWALVAGAVIFGGGFALACGRWGDRAWRSMLNFLSRS